MALAVLPRVTPFCADRHGYPWGDALTLAATCPSCVGRDFEVGPSSPMGNPATNLAIQSKRQIESIRKFLDIFIQPQGETSWPGKHLASSRSLSAWKSTPTPAPTCNLRGVAET
jgi:hypothetical protein